MKRRIGAATLAGLTVVALAVTGASGSSSHARYYLALGDSLSQGVQPNPSGVSLETTDGYADQLFALEQRQAPGLQLVKLGCPGDTTASMLTGKGNAKNARKFKCDRTGGSQVAAAVRFLKAHHKRGEVAVVTVDIGANDVDGCTAPGVNIANCVSSGLNSIAKDTPKILKALRKAAPAGTKLVAMNLYDPVLSQWWSTNASAHGLAIASVAFLQAVNNAIAKADQSSGFKTADVAGAFASYSKANITFDGEQVPVNVARICSWTWACTTPPSGPNIHANKNGYAVIAAAFAKTIGRI